MSEIAHEGAADTTPTSSTEAAEQVIDAFEGTETNGVEVSGDTVPAATETAEAAPLAAKAQEEPELSAAAKFLIAQGHKFKKVDGRPTFLPVSTVEKMLDRYQAQHRATWDGERGVIESRATELQGYIDNLKAGVSGDPRLFLEELAGHDPRYRSFLEQAQAQQQAPPVSEMPDPDLRLGDGSSTYSLEGLKKLLEWNTQQVEARLLPKVEERIKPFAEREQQAKVRESQERTKREMQGRSHDQITEAQTWPLFGPLAADGTLTEVQTAVLAELQKDSAAAKAAGRRPSLTLEGAYIKVTTPKLVADRNKMREDLIKELNGAARGTAVSRGGAEPNRAPGIVATTADIAARTLARLERDGS